MKTSVLAGLLLCVLTVQASAADQAAAAGGSQAVEAATARSDGVPIERIIAAFAKKSGKKILLDPRVHADVVLLGQDPLDLTYAQLLAVLEIHGFAAVDDAGLLQIVPESMIRAEPMPLITSKDTRPGPEYVTEVIALKYLSAPQLVPILRPMIAMQGHLVALPQAHALIITDRFSNVRRIEALVKSLDTPENKSAEAEAQK